MRETVIAYTWNFLIPSLGIKWWPLTICIKDVMEAIVCDFHRDACALIPMTLCCSICARDGYRLLVTVILLFDMEWWRSKSALQFVL